MQTCAKFVRENELFREGQSLSHVYSLDHLVMRDPGSALLKRATHARSLVEQYTSLLGEKMQRYYSENLQLLADISKGNAQPSCSLQSTTVTSSTPQVTKDKSYFTSLKDALAFNQVVLIKGATGSGKSTCIPTALLDTNPDGKIIVSEPRRVAAISLARYQQQTAPDNLRHTIAYAIRFQSTVTDETRLIYQTDGVTLQYLLDDPCMLKVSYLILDEIHERSSNQILLLAMVLRVIKYNPRIRIILMSATLNEVHLLQYVRRYTTSATISLDGPKYATESIFLPCREDYILQIVDEVANIHSTSDNLDDGILVFLSGTDDITVCLALLWERLSTLGERHGEKSWLVIPFHSKIPVNQSLYPFMPVVGRRKIILATNVAETSITIPGIRYVIDSGLQKRMVFLPEHNANVLVVIPITYSSHMQRRGRVGRMQHGTCIFLYPKHVAEHEMLANPHSVLQFESIDQIYLMLQAFLWRFERLFPSFPLHLEFTDLIDHVDSARLAITKQGLYYSYLLMAHKPFLKTHQLSLYISVAGLTATSLPVSPRIALFLIVARHYGIQKEACLIAAGLEIGWDDLLGSNNTLSLCQGSDHLSLLYALTGAPSKTSISFPSHHQATQIARQLENALEKAFNLHRDTLLNFLHSHMNVPDITANNNLATETGDILKLCLVLTSHMTIAQRTSGGFRTLFSGAIVNPSRWSACAGTTSRFLLYDHSIAIANKAIAICCTEISEDMLRLNKRLLVGTAFEVASHSSEAAAATAATTTTKLGFRRNIKR